jgi:hypothetical protein
LRRPRSRRSPLRLPSPSRRQPRIAKPISPPTLPPTPHPKKQVLLISGGRTAYYGPPSGVPASLAAAGLPLPEGAAPAEFLLSVVSRPGGAAALAGASSDASSAAGAAAAAPPGAAGAPAARRRGKGAAAMSAVPLALPAAAGCDVNVALGGRADQGLSPKGAGGAGSPFELSSPAASDGGAAATPARRARGTALARAAAAAREALGRRRREAAVLFWRAFTNTRREPRLLGLHLGVGLVLGLFVGAGEPRARRGPAGWLGGRFQPSAPDAGARSRVRWGRWLRHSVMMPPLAIDPP